MTADIVDGMGTSGTSGVFQRCAEETLRVLREESDVIMTVLEVFKYDPLHTWLALLILKPFMINFIDLFKRTASELKVKQAQSEVPTATTMTDASRFNLGIGIDMSSGSADEAADRALSSVARKLDRSLSVESTVNELLAEATDPLNLATIFFGKRNKLLLLLFALEPSHRLECLDVTPHSAYADYHHDNWLFTCLPNYVMNY